ncbi:hypothetical protein SLS58_007545 [Diplodia intermedia]|uniref:EKC/KEOPS complex subunit BUD32 n=1 Tax=Diplodia intermedia TaxID=856260 RepID=A0ABR3TJV0_9PEZI
MSAVCLVLNLIGAQKFLMSFIAKFILDATLPLQKEVIVSVLPDSKKALEFLGEQYRANPRFMIPQTHHRLEDIEPTPYLTVRELREGGSGYVNKAKDVTANKIYARKLWRCTGRSAREAEIGLEEEVQILKKLLNHNHIIQLVNKYRRENIFGPFMSPVAKANLYDIIELPSDERAWAMPVLRRSPGCLTSALADINSLKIRHKDITPKNILICDDDAILTDFGISVDVSEMTSTDSTGPTARTRQYCSPEVANHDKRGRSSDVFSLGCVILVILTLLRENDSDGLVEVLSFRPFSQSVDQMQSWIQHQSELGQESLETLWLEVCREFIHEAPQSRPTAKDALKTIFSESLPEKPLKNSFCGDCLSNNDTLEYAEKRHESRRSVQAAQTQVHHAQSPQLEDDIATDSTNRGI